jgi:hypothetical protein
MSIAATSVARPYRWFGRDAPRGGWPVPPCPPDPPVGPLSPAWAWASAADRADPRGRSTVWTRAELEATRVVLRSGGVDLPPEALVRAMVDHLDQLAATPPGQGQPRTVFAALLSGAARQDGPAVLRAITALRGWRIAAVPAWEAEAPWGRTTGIGAGRVGDAVVARTAAGGGWTVPDAPLGWYGAPGPPLRGGGPVAAPAIWAAGVRGDVAAALARLPRSPAVWRRDALLTLLGRITPLELCGGVPPDEAGLGLLAEAVADTRLEGPILATAGEWLLAEGRVGAEARGAAGRCVRALAAARGLPDPDAVRLFVEVRDAATGAVDVGSEAFVRGALAPVEASLLAEDPAGFVRAVLRVDGLGGTDAVVTVLDRLLAEGATTPAGLRRIGAGLGRDASRISAILAGTVHAGWLGLAPEG